MYGETTIREVAARVHDPAELGADQQRNACGRNEQCAVVGHDAELDVHFDIAVVVVGERPM